MPPSLFPELQLLIKRLNDAHARADERAKATHARFNLFTTLLKIDDEERLHTRFIHCLLDPNGSHDCGTLFLRLFIETLLENGVTDHGDVPLDLEIPHADSGWKAERETLKEEFGRINILLHCPNYGLAIENKIHAGEQERQLARYAEYIDESKGKGLVLFLTLDGRTSCTHDSQSGCTIRYARISYAIHILAWLEKCLHATYNIIPINQSLIQYSAVIKELTGRNMESSTTQQVTAFVLENPDIIRFRRQLEAGIAAAKADFLDRLADGVTRRLTAEGLHIKMRENLSEGRFGCDRNAALIITPQAESPLNNTPFSIWLEHIDKWAAIVVGIETKYGKPQLPPDKIKLLEVLDGKLETYSEEFGYHKSTPMPSWQGTYYPTGWHDIVQGFDDEKLASFLSNPMDNNVSQICEAVKKHITLLERLLIEAQKEVSE